MVSRIIPVETFDLIIFGGTGDLARRKILPGLFKRFCDGQIPPGSRIIAAARSEMDLGGFQEFVTDAIADALGLPEPDQIADFADLLDYVPIDALSDQGWPELAEKLPSFDNTRAFYFSVGPSIFEPLAERLHRHKVEGARITAHVQADREHHVDLPVEIEVGKRSLIEESLI